MMLLDLILFFMQTETQSGANFLFRSSTGSLWLLDYCMTQLRIQMLLLSKGWKRSLAQRCATLLKERRRYLSVVTLGSNKKIMPAIISDNMGVTFSKCQKMHLDMCAISLAFIVH